jgi:NAD(P)-dependent dehydrogenase (short-subunit alcohol dehydrogenase family)
MFVPDLLAKKRILITGGGSGLGKSIATRYAELGAKVIICGRREGVLAETAAAISEGAEQRVEFQVCDVRDADAVETMMATVWEGGPLDVLLNGAAGNFIARTERLSARAFDSVLNIVLHGTAYCTLAAGKRWIGGNQPGAVLCIGTTSALTGGPYSVASASAKAGVLAMMRSLAVEWGPHGIRTAVVAPGLFPTPGAWEQLFPAKATPEPQHLTVPLRRLGEHRELANLFVYLASDAASYITGECFVIDGGRSRQGVNGNIARTLESWSDEDWQDLRNGSR